MFWTVILYIISIYFCLMLPVRIIAALRKPTSVYADQPEQQNPMEGKKVAFVADENDKANADGVRGHLEAVGIASHTASFYEKYIKRGLDILISFGGLIVLSPLLACLSLAIYIDDPGPVLFCQKRLGKNKQYFSLHKFRSMKMITLARCIIGTTLKVA